MERTYVFFTGLLIGFMLGISFSIIGFILVVVF